MTVHPAVLWRNRSLRSVASDSHPSGGVTRAAGVPLAEFPLRLERSNVGGRRATGTTKTVGQWVEVETGVSGHSGCPVIVRLQAGGPASTDHVGRCNAAWAGSCWGPIADWVTPVPIWRVLGEAAGVGARVVAVEVLARSPALPPEAAVAPVRPGPPIVVTPADPNGTVGPPSIGVRVSDAEAPTAGAAGGAPGDAAAAAGGSVCRWLAAPEVEQWVRRLPHQLTAGGDAGAGPAGRPDA